MKKYLLMLCVAMMTLNSFRAAAQFNEKNLTLTTPAAGKEYLYKNLQLYPVRANEVFRTYYQNLGHYLSLKEGLEQKKVLITEHVDSTQLLNEGNNASGARVNTLYIENFSEDTIIILAGEVVKGIKQDRVIAQDMLLYPHSGKIDLSVFCVEHGRWAAADIQVQSQSQENVVWDLNPTYYSVTTKKVRKAAVLDKDQQEVWNEVEQTTEKNGAISGSGSYTALANSDSFKVDMTGYKEYFEKLFVNESNIIGVVAVSGDSILGCDMFATHELFVKHYSSLLESYATEAITQNEKVTVTPQRVEAYLKEIISDEANQEEKIEKNGTFLKSGTKLLHISTF